MARAFPARIFGQFGNNPPRRVRFDVAAWSEDGNSAHL
jgi:hypothetical protein